jgi:hypothetical protein
MSKPRFTPGPWEVCDDLCSVHSPKADVIVATYPHRKGDNQPDFAAQTQEELEGNARLIAAAPKMYLLIRSMLTDEFSIDPALRIRIKNKAWDVISEIEGR